MRAELEIQSTRSAVPESGDSETAIAGGSEVPREASAQLVGKDPASPYSGGRTLKWLKVKVPKYREGERGWEPREKP